MSDSDTLPAPDTDLWSLGLATFEEWTGQTFLLAITQGDALSLTLIKASPSPYNKGRPRGEGGGSFTLVFQGPSDRYFQQGTALVTLPDGQLCSMFMVNHGPRDGAMEYSVTVN